MRICILAFVILVLCSVTATLQAIGFLIYEKKEPSVKMEKPHHPKTAFAPSNTAANLKHLYKTRLYAVFQQTLLAKGFPPTAIPRLFCVAYLESGFNTKAKNRNRNGTVDVGLFQINSVWWPQCGDPGRSLEANLDCAKVVLEQQGLNAWVTYKEQGWVCERALEG